jgi:hypothetical protein
MIEQSITVSMNGLCQNRGIVTFRRNVVYVFTYRICDICESDYKTRGRRKERDLEVAEQSFSVKRKGRSKRGQVRSISF